MNTSKETLLGKTKVSKALFQLSFPAAIAMIVQSLYNIVDTIFIGHAMGYTGIASLNVAYPIQMIIVGFGTLIGVGAASIISRLLGEKETHEASTVANKASIYLFFNRCIFNSVTLPTNEPYFASFWSFKKW